MTLNRIFFHKENQEAIMPHKSIKNRAGRCLLLLVILMSCSISVSDANRYNGVDYEIYSEPYYENNILMRYIPVYAYVFDADRNIEDVNIPFKVLVGSNRCPVRVIKKAVFRDFRYLKVVDMRQTQMTSIEEEAFMNCSKLDSVFLPEPTDEKLFLTEIAYNSFRLCSSLKYIKIPVKVKIIGKYAFWGCSSLPHIDIPYTVEMIMDYAFRGCSSLKSIVISTKVGSLGEGAFQDCIAMETAEFYNKYPLNIKPLAFDNCKNLKTVKFNYNTIVLIDSCAFRGCTSLRKFTIPALLTQGVGPLAFEGCTALDSVTSLADVPPAMGKDAFRDISPTCVLTVPYGRTQAYRAAGWTEQVFKGGIVEMPAPAGISIVRVKPSDTRYYDLEGRPVAKPEKGRIYIHDGRKVVK